MTPEQIEEMKRDREAGTPGPWAASPMHIEEGDPAVRTPEGWIIANVPWDREARRIARVPDLEAHILALTAEIDRLRAKVEAGGWQPIETAPRGTPRHGKKGMAWMLLAWPDGNGDFHTASGMRVGDAFYACATFYCGGPFDRKQFELREHEVSPTHWRPSPEPPTAYREAGE